MKLILFYAICNGYSLNSVRNKNYILLLLGYCLLPITVDAQFSPEQNDKNGKWQIGININTIEDIHCVGNLRSRYESILISGHMKDKSYNVGLNISYKLKEDFSVRLSAKKTTYNIKATNNSSEYSPFSSNMYETQNWEMTSSKLNLSLGGLWTLSHKRIDYFFGGEFMYKKYNNILVHWTIALKDTSNNTYSNAHTDFNQDGGYSLGIGPFAGFSIRIFKSISVNLEFSSAFSYYKVGGNITVVNTNLLPPYNMLEQNFPGTSVGYNFFDINTGISLFCEI